MARITITTRVPAGTQVSDARLQARVAAAEALHLTIVEDTLLPLHPKVMQTQPSAEDGSVGETILVDSPNDHTVDRVLTTVWDFTGAGGGQ